DVLQLEEEVERGFVNRAVHRRGGHHRRGHENRVRDRPAVYRDRGSDERPHAEADGEQVEQRLEKAGDDEHPVAPVEDRVALHQVRGATDGGWLRPAAGRQGRDHFESRRRIVMLAATIPTVAYASSTTTSTPADDVIRPMVRPRASATPCASGVSQAIPWRTNGSWWIGKNAPPRRKSGVMMKRPI